MTDRLSDLLKPLSPLYLCVMSCTTVMNKFCVVCIFINTRPPRALTMES